MSNIIFSFKTIYTIAHRDIEYLGYTDYITDQL